MDDINIENKVTDNSSEKKKITSNTNPEKENTVNGTEEKKKKKHKAKKKKKNCILNTEQKPTDNVNAGMETVNTEKEITDNVSAGSETDNAEKNITDNVNAGRETANAELRTIDKAKAEQKTTEDANVMQGIEIDNAEKEIFDNVNAKQEIPNKVDPKLEIPYKANPENTDYLFELSSNFVYDFQLYLMRCYDIFKQGFSDIEEEPTDLPLGCKVLLRGSIGRYKCTNYFNKYYSYIYRENRYQQLKDTFMRELIEKGDILHSEFLCFAALFVLVAHDLKTLFNFHEAQISVNDALVDAIMATKQRKFMSLWNVKWK